MKHHITAKLRNWVKKHKNGVVWDDDSHVYLSQYDLEDEKYGEGWLLMIHETVVGWVYSERSRAPEQGWPESLLKLLAEMEVLDLPSV